MRPGSHAGPPGPPGIGGEAADASAAGGALLAPAERKGDRRRGGGRGGPGADAGTGRAGGGALLRRAADRPGERCGDDAGRGRGAGVRGRRGAGGADAGPVVRRDLRPRNRRAGVRRRDGHRTSGGPGRAADAGPHDGPAAGGRRAGTAPASVGPPATSTGRRTAGRSAGAGSDTMVSRTVEFAVRADEPGVHSLNLSIRADGEATYDNNNAQRWLKVLPEKIRVAAYAGGAVGLSVPPQHPRPRRVPGLRLARGGGARFPVRAAAGIAGADPRAGRAHPVRHTGRRHSTGSSGPRSTSSSNARRQRDLRRRTGHGPRRLRAEPLAGALMPFPQWAPPAWRTWSGDRPSFRLVPGPGFDRDALRIDSSTRGGDAEDSAARWPEQLPGMYPRPCRCSSSGTTRRRCSSTPKPTPPC